MWVDTAERLPDFGRRVLVWGEHCNPDSRAPVAYLRSHASEIAPFWCSTEYRGSFGITHWWDGPLPSWADEARPAPVFGGAFDCSARRPGERLATDEIT